VSISQDGRITGVFTNGQTRTIGQVALAKFVAPTALTKLGKNLYAQTYDSGQPLVGAAGTSGLGSIVSNSLELSNVDLAQEFVNMISAQRGFEANSRIITTTDELMQEVVNLKR
jgi:flagellar hook protein FlgE